MCRILIWQYRFATKWDTIRIFIKKCTIGVMINTLLASSYCPSSIVTVISSNVLWRLKDQRNKGSVIKMETLQDRARRKSRTSLKIFKETHRIVPEPRTKRRGGRERKPEREEKSIATGVRMKGTERFLAQLCSLPCTVRFAKAAASIHPPVRIVVGVSETTANSQIDDGQKEYGEAPGAA
ncbi:PREDICTED: uncharacterized protein LOC105145679 [Acromyrmex echinatior]|uniref:uncharacterized protein LOC105145679 n=1 Tax=Acromyrmex echinatior TaxID=103372 RepID=UPI0005810D5B|nr:PREDICTED: uncharacterized protein LOC105145679 [Acromyrmex echinatior]